MTMLADILDIEFPIIQAPMAGVQDADLAVAVSAAGGLGSLPAAMLNLEKLEVELEKLKKINRPYNVNFFCHTPPKVDQQREQLWRQTLNSFYDEFDIDPDSLAPGPSREPFSDQSARLLEAYKPAVVSFHFGLPDAQLLRRVKAWGALILSSATTVAEALWLEQNGVDVIIAQGLEAGGHRGMFLTDDLTTQMSTLCLLPQIIQKVNLPVIAAGGIANAEAVRAMLSMGACAVQVGTAYLLCNEAKTSVIHRNALKSSRASHTALTNLFSGRPARGIVNRIMQEIGPLNDAAPQFPLAGDALAVLRKAAEQRGSGDFSPLWSGQNNSACAEVGAAELTRSLASG